ncbi:heavy-metal-associated domain-containing protein [Pedobacter sp. P351]|uniref:heavy-metal-associated domain-containing protein n=1 Tax=Pedobacter superstes TaxID=3133441 RepID=UPI0030B29302
MKKYQFKTTINCGGCVARLTPHLNANAGIKNWNVDINDPQKTLTVETENMEETDIKKIVEKLGFKADPI